MEKRSAKFEVKEKETVTATASEKRGLLG